MDSHSVLVQDKLDEIGTLILHLAFRSGTGPLEPEALERFRQKVVDLEASQKFMFEAGKRLFAQILAFRDFLDSHAQEPRPRDVGSP